MAPRQKKKKRQSHNKTARSSSKGKAKSPKQEHTKKLKDEDVDWCAPVRRVKTKRTYPNKKRQQALQKQAESKSSEAVNVTCTSTTYVNSVTTTPYTQTYKQEKHANVVAWVNSNPYTRTRTPTPTPPPPPPNRPNALQDPINRGFALYKLSQIIKILEGQLEKAEKERKMRARNRTRPVRGRCCT